MANLNLSVDYVNVPPEGIRLVEDTHAEWLRLDEAERAAALADPVEVAATRRQQGARAAGAWPSPSRATVDAQRPRYEEEQYTPAGLHPGRAGGAGSFKFIHRQH